MRLRHVQQGDFRKSELTNFELIRTIIPHIANTLTADDVILFVSQSGKMLLFVWGFRQFTHAGFTHTTLPSAKLRLTGGSKWDPDMLAAYAASAGITISNFHLMRRYYQQAVQFTVNHRP